MCAKGVKRFSRVAVTMIVIQRKSVCSFLSSRLLNFGRFSRAPMPHVKNVAVKTLWLGCLFEKLLFKSAFLLCGGGLFKFSGYCLSVLDPLFFSFCL